MNIISFDVNSINQNLTKLRIIESVDQLSNCTFSWSWLTDQTNGFLSIDLEIDSFENPMSSCWISKPNINELDFSFESWVVCINNVILILIKWIDFPFLIGDHKDLFSCLHTFSCWRTILFCLSCWKSSKHDSEDCDENIFSFVCLFNIFEESSSNQEYYCINCVLTKIRKSNS